MADDTFSDDLSDLPDAVLKELPRGKVVASLGDEKADAIFGERKPKAKRSRKNTSLADTSIRADAQRHIIAEIRKCEKRLEHLRERLKRISHN